jgi:CRISPR-associated protein Cas2
MTVAHHVQSFAIAYDLSDDRERARVDKVLKGWGRRVQKSVFMVRAPKRGVDRLKAELERLELRSGSVLFFRLQANVKTASVGLAFDDPDEALAYVI